MPKHRPKTAATDGSNAAIWAGSAGTLEQTETAQPVASTQSRSSVPQPVCALPEVTPAICAMEVSASSTAGRRWRAREPKGGEPEATDPSGSEQGAYKKYSIGAADFQLSRLASFAV
jgi:hypothetical protein